MEFLKKNKSILLCVVTLILVAIGAVSLFELDEVSLVMSGRAGDRVQCVVRYEDGHTDRHELVVPATLILKGNPRRFEFDLTNLSDQEKDSGERVDVFVRESHGKCKVGSSVHDGRILTGKINFTTRYRVGGRFTDRQLDAADPNA